MRITLQILNFLILIMKRLETFRKILVHILLKVALMEL
jgi:hypothetical protein